MRIIIAPDSYKGSLSALEAAEAMADGLGRVFPEAEIIKTPIADGGEGTVEALTVATGGRIKYSAASDPLGREIRAAWGLLGDGRTAVIEMAAASGLPLLRPEERDPQRASTFGSGELLRAVLDEGLPRLIIGLGGSATNDGGAGFASALGARFLDGRGRELPPGGAALTGLKEIDLSGLDPRLKNLEILVACDVDNPLCGPKGASAVFGPQKGADPATVRELDAALANFGRLAEAATGRKVMERPGAGAAGGFGAGLLFFTEARLRPGIELILEIIDFERLAAEADLIVTGEGLTDYQTAYGKAPVGVAEAARKYDIPVIGLSGGLGRGYEDVLERGISALMPCPPGPMTLEECLAAGKDQVAEAAERLGRLLRAGQQLGRKSIDPGGKISGRS